MFVPSQVKTKSLVEPESELCKFLREKFRIEQETVIPSKSSYEPHRYIIDVVHCEPLRILLGSLEENKFANLFKPDPAVLEALSAKPPLDVKINPNAAKPLFQNLPELKPVSKRTFLDDVDEVQITVQPKQKVTDKGDSLFKIEKDKSEQGGLFGFSMELPKLSRVGGIDEDDASSVIKFDDELDDAADDLFETEQEKPANKRQKTNEQSKRLDKEVESFMKRKFEQ